MASARTLRISSVLFAFVFMILYLTANTSQAVPLQSLFDGDSMTVNDKTFHSWNLDLLDAPTSPDFWLIDVVGLSGDPLNPGISFEGNEQLFVSGEFGFNLIFSFTVTSSGGLIKDNSLEIVDYSFDGNGGWIDILEFVSDLSANELAVKNVYADNGFGDFYLFDSQNFAPQQSIVVENDILLFGDSVGDVVNLKTFEQHFSQEASSQEAIPEPGTLLLLSTGLAGLAGYGIRSRRKRKA